MEILCQQKFADLHDGDRIFYSNITRCYETFKEIEKLDHEVILITGNGPEFVGHYEDPNAKYNEAYQYLNDIFHNLLVPGVFRILHICVYLRDEVAIFIL